MNLETRLHESPGDHQERWSACVGGDHGTLRLPLSRKHQAH